jgi:type IV secretion system protein TrbG
MNKTFNATLFGTILAVNNISSAAAQQVPAVPSVKVASIRHSGYFSRATLPVLSKETIKLDQKQRKSISLANEWKNKSAPTCLGENGYVQFIHGVSFPSVVCAPLYACDIALQAGEVIRQILLGDASRWKVSPGTSGTGDNTVAHLVVKPSDVGLSTNLVIYTDRRSYNIRLVSTKEQWMPLVSFVYPDDTQAQWDSYRAHQQPLKAQATSFEARSSADELNFNYRIKGDSPNWKPVRVYSDSAKTYIQFPANVKNDQIPALVILDSGHQMQLVNYRMLGNRYVVDLVIDRAALIRGVGRHQERVEISREGS